MYSKRTIKNVKRVLIILGIIFLCYLTSKGQVVLNGNDVCMPLDEYRKFRTVILQSDTLRLECDSIIKNQEKQMITKDSIINVKINKIILKDSIIVQKDKTIEKLTIDIKEPFKNIFSKEFWIGLSSGVFSVLLLLR